MTRGGRRDTRWVLPAIGGAAYLLVAAICTQIPLLHTLGYEFAFVIGLVATIVATLTTIASVRDADPAGTGPPEDRMDAVLRVFGRSVLSNLALLLIPFVAASANKVYDKYISIITDTNKMSDPLMVPLPL